MPGSPSVLSDAIVLILCEREDRLGRPSPRESLLERTEVGTSENKESLLSEGSGNLKGEGSLVGEVTTLVGVYLRISFKLRLYLSHCRFRRAVFGR